MLGEDEFFERAEFAFGGLEHDEDFVACANLIPATSSAIRRQG